MAFLQMVGFPVDLLPGGILGALDLSSKKKNGTKCKVFPVKKCSFHSSAPCRELTRKLLAGWLRGQWLYLWERGKGKGCSGNFGPVANPATRGWNRAIREGMRNILYSLEPDPNVKGTCQILGCVSGGTENSPCFCGPWLCCRLFSPLDLTHEKYRSYF